MVVETRHSVDAVGLSHAAGVGVGRGVVVDEKSVVVAARGLGDFKRPPAALAWAFQWQHAVAKFERHLVSFWGPDTKLVHFCDSPCCIQLSRASSATGKSRSSDSTLAAPASMRSPVNEFFHVPGGISSDVSPHFPASIVVHRGTTVRIFSSRR